MTNFKAAGRSLVASMSLRTNLQQSKLHHPSGDYVQKMRSVDRRLNVPEKNDENLAHKQR